MDSLLLFLAFGVFFVFMFVVVLAFIGKRRTRVPFLATPRPVIHEVLNLLSPGAGGYFYDLGCGNGRVAFAIADAYLETRVVGIEKSPLPYLLARCILFLKPRKNVEILYSSFEDVSLAKATHVFVYLLPAVMQTLLPQLERELPKGAKLVACDFPFVGKEPVTIQKIGYGFKIHTLYLYEF